jgi:hypothetical protein
LVEEGWGEDDADELVVLPVECDERVDTWGRLGSGRRVAGRMGRLGEVDVCGVSVAVAGDPHPWSLPASATSWR